MVDVTTITQEQLDALEAGVAQLEKFKNDSEPQLAEYATKKAEWEQKEKEFKDLQEQQNPNWQKARKSMDAMRNALKEKGLDVDEDGNVKSSAQNIDIEKVRQEAIQAAKNEMLGGRLEELLGEYEPKAAEIVRHYYNKLTAGETVTLQNLRTFIVQAENVARSNPENTISKAATFSGGQGPRQAVEGVLDDASAKELASKMGLSFANKK